MTQCVHKPGHKPLCSGTVLENTITKDWKFYLLFASSSSLSVALFLVRSFSSWSKLKKGHRRQVSGLYRISENNKYWISSKWTNWTCNKHISCNLNYNTLEAAGRSAHNTTKYLTCLVKDFFSVSFSELWRFLISGYITWTSNTRYRLPQALGSQAANYSSVH